MLHCNILVLPKVLKYPIQALKSLVKTLRKIRRETIWYDVVVLVDYEIVPELCPSIWNLRSLYVAGSIYHISALYAMKNPELTVCMVLTFSLVDFFFRKRDIYICLVKYVPCCLYTLNPLSLSLILWSRLLFCFNFIFS